MQRLRRLFSRTPEGAHARRRALPFLGIAVFIVIVLLAIPPAWEYSNSTTFCGETCHTMPPEYQTYLISPHARVPCVDCHIGRGLIIQQAYRKTAHMHLLFDTITGNYEYPIQVSSMRPARQTCELCHFPEKFSDDSLRTISRFRPNESSDPYDLYLLMHTGGGSAREGLGFGIHWHVENPIEFIATDDRQQEIPWVRVQNADGSFTVYQAEDSTIDEANLEQYEVVEMDCITCHNRISHQIQPPDTLVDNALQRGDLSVTIPNIRAVAAEILDQPYESLEAGETEIPLELASYYQETYPDYSAANATQIETAGETLQTIWSANNFPEQELDWQAHPNNIGHRDWPGCFRCHDGRHFTETDEAIRLECNLCHSIPQIVEPDDIEPMLPLTTGNEPESHLDSTWISGHHNEFDRTCTNCHTVENPGGTSDTSFCSNSACHGAGWEYAGFDAPALALEMGLSQTGAGEGPTLETEAELTYQTFWPLLMIACGRCHDSTPINGLTVTTYESLLSGGDSGPALVPGAPEDSLILNVLANGHFGNMTAEQIDLFSQWIANGAPEGGLTTGALASYETLGPILTTTCGSCHGEADPERGFDVTSYETLLAGSRGGPVMEAGSMEDSLILEVLGEGHFAELSEAEMELLQNWIMLGMPETNEEAASLNPIELISDANLYASVQDIFNSRCVECHGGDEPDGQLDLSTYESILAGSRYGPIVEPGSPEDSYLLEVLQEEHPGDPTTDQYLTIQLWIARGIPN